MNSNSRKKMIRNIAFILIGLFCDAFGTAAFVLPYGFVAGGVTGIGRVFHHYFGMEISIVVGALSLALLLLGLVTLGKKFASTIVAGSILFPVFLDLLGRIPALQHLTGNPLLAAVFAAILMGAGLGLLVRAGASSGGSDVVPIILNRKFGWPVAPLMYAVDATILLIQLPFADTEQVLYGILIALLLSVTMNKVVLFGSSDVQFTIISKKYREINEVLQNHLDVGTTLTHGETGHLGNDLDVILCVVNHESVHRVKDAVLKVDPEAFMTMVNVSGVSGRGFTMARRYW